MTGLEQIGIAVASMDLTPFRRCCIQVSISTPKEPKSATLARPVVSWA
jgi:hypothetical protein